MNGKTLASIFDSIPPHIHFPWVVSTELKTATHSVEEEEEEIGGGLQDLLHHSSDNNFQSDDEFSDDSGEGFQGLEGATMEGGVDLRSAELAAIEAKARQAHGQKLLDTIEGAKAAASTAAIQRSRAATTSGSKRPRAQGGRVDRSDPDAKLLDALLEANAAMIAGWEAKRSALTADEQEALLLVPDDTSKQTSGAVCLFHSLKGYGFIAPDCGGPDVYFTRDAIVMPESVKEVLGEASFGVGERVTFGVSLNDSHSTRRLKAEGVKAERAGGEPDLAFALKGPQFCGKVRNFNAEGNRGYIQSAEKELGDEPAVDQLTTLQRCHRKGMVDAVFSLTTSQIDSGFVPSNGAMVRYFLMPNLDLKSGRALAVGCIFENEAESGEDQLAHSGSLAGLSGGQSGTLMSTTVTAGAMDEPLFKKGRPEVQTIVNASAQSQAPKLLLLDTDDTW